MSVFLHLRSKQNTMSSFPKIWEGAEGIPAPLSTLSAVTENISLYHCDVTITRLKLVNYG